jgi:hypothetical protein
MDTVAMQFLEVKRAHLFWRSLVVGTVVVYVGSFTAMY